jgi:hypothetical protein
MACLAIGVSNAEPLDFLSGAANSAKAIGEWADRNGYLTKVLTDENDPVTVVDVKEALIALLPFNRTTDRLILYFAGHGVLLPPTEELWLLSDWRSEQYAVSVSGIKRRLKRYGLRQLSIIADACRSLPSDGEAADLQPHYVLPRGRVDPTDPPQLDHMMASSAFRAAYMIRGHRPDGSDDRCIFSGVLIEALWGHPGALMPPNVTSGSLYRYLRPAVSQVATRYGVDMRPEIHPGFVAPEDVYFKPGAVKPPPAVPWPGPPPTTPPTTGSDVAGGHLSGSTAGSEWRKSRAEDRERATQAARDVDAKVKSLKSAYSAEAMPSDFGTGCGFTVSGASALRAYLGPEGHASLEQDGAWWRIMPSREVGSPWSGGTLRQPLPLLVRLEDGNWAAGAALPGFLAAFTVLPQSVPPGVSSMLYRRFRHWGADKDTEHLVENAVVRMTQGVSDHALLRDFVAEIRHFKHANPILGALAAYLYDAIGDINSIRRIAWFYAAANEPIPFDVALLAQIRITREAGIGTLAAEVPEVRRSHPESDGELRFPELSKRTFAINGTVAGEWPLLRQGWSVLDEDELPLLPDITAIGRSLTGAPFATLRADGGGALASLLVGEDI